jgi:hypothetical protein
MIEIRVDCLVLEKSAEGKKKRKGKGKKEKKEGKR